MQQASESSQILVPSSSSIFAHGQCDCDCDCACTYTPHTPFTITNEIVNSWCTASAIQIFSLPFGWYGLHYSARITSLILLNRPAYKSILEHYNSRKTILNSMESKQIRFAHRNSLAGLISPLSYLADGQLKADNSQLTSWLHLTDRCNLQCDYCYLTHVHRDMPLETGRAVIDATFRSVLVDGFKQVKLKFAGGEPLLRFPLIVDLHRYAQSLAAKHGLCLEGVVLSNGTLLTAEMVETLKALGLRLMISLDGLGAYHDAHRRYAGGRGSFKDVSEAVDLALANGLMPNISVTVSNRTAEGLPEIVAWILERNLPFSLNFYRENELSASHEDMRLDEQKIVNGMLATFKVIENNLPRSPFLGGIIDRANLSVSHTHTCGVGQNYLVFDQNGQIAKCQMHIRKPITDLHVADPLAVIRADQSGIQNLSVEEKEGCKTCDWKHWCAGGCPLATYRATGRYDIKSPNCSIYKALFPEALRLEGLRLLKYQDDPEVVQKIPA
jgi:uncharacterized protein